MKVVSAKPGAIAVSVHSADANLAGRYDLEVQAGWTLQDVRSRLQQRVQERSSADGKIQFMRWTLTKLFAGFGEAPQLLDEQWARRRWSKCICWAASKIGAGCLCRFGWISIRTGFLRRKAGLATS